MSKGAQTKATILDTALKLVRKLGFDAVSISHLAKAVGMSKSGLFAHFNSKESMHIMILDHAAESFSNKIFVPAVKVERGIPRLRAIINNWEQWYGKKGSGTCPFVAAAVNYSNKPGKVKDRLQHHLSILIASLAKAIDLAVEEGHFKKSVDSEKLAYQIYSLVIGLRVYRGPLAHTSADELFASSIDDLIKEHSA